MTIKELKKKLDFYNDNAEIVVSSDEELNVLFQDLELCVIENQGKKIVVIFGLSGTEIPETYEE